jgi:hypothetical protein
MAKIQADEGETNENIFSIGLRPFSGTGGLFRGDFTGMAD